MLCSTEPRQAQQKSAPAAGGRSKAAAYRKLRACLRESPAFLYEAVEEAMAEDFNQVRTTPSLASVPVSTRGWVEHRSRLGPYPASIRAMWILGAAHDCLKEGKVEEARARVALALCAYDQSTADSGNWLLSQELLLEQAPPYSSFNRVRGGNDAGDVLHTRLADARWIEILMARLRDQDAYNEAKQRLTSKRRQQAPHTEDPPAPGETPKGRAQRGWQRPGPLCQRTGCGAVNAAVRSAHQVAHANPNTSPPVLPGACGSGLPTPPPRSGLGGSRP